MKIDMIVSLCTYLICRSQLLVLREKLTAEREEERRCKEEFREIAGTYVRVHMW